MATESRVDTWPLITPLIGEELLAAQDENPALKIYLPGKYQ